MSSLPMYFPPDFDLSAASLCAELTAHAYKMYQQWEDQGKPRKESGFTWQPPTGTGLTFSSPIWSTYRWLFIDDSEPFGFVASDGAGRGYLAFRGTESTRNWLTDADADQEPYDPVAGYGTVHDGFRKLYNSLRQDMMKGFDEVGGIDSLWVTGHSLGCGLSTLAVPDILAHKSFRCVQHYAFASPRVGDPVFTDAYNANGAPTYRIVNTCDIVPQLPSSLLGEFVYKHVGIPVNFTAQYGGIGANHNITHAYGYALNHPDQPENTKADAA